MYKFQNCSTCLYKLLQIFFKKKNIILIRNKKEAIEIQLFTIQKFGLSFKPKKKKQFFKG